MENPRPPLVMAELSTARLVLRPLDPTLDAADLFEMDADPLVHQFVYGFSPSRSINQLKRRLAADLNHNGGLTWALRLRGDPTRTRHDRDCRGPRHHHPRPRLELATQSAESGTHERSSVRDRALSACTTRVDGLEAWADSRNIGSLKVAARAGLTEGARLPRSYEERVGQTVVMAVLRRRSIRACSLSPRHWTFMTSG